jgi:hypothetical protein
MPTALEVGREGARTQYVGFLIPKRIVKNGEERLVVLNRVAASVIEECRGNHPEYVFAWKRGLGGKNWPTKSMNNTSWQTGRESAAKTYGAIFGENAPAGFANLREHDLKHTFGRKLWATGVSLEIRKVLWDIKTGTSRRIIQRLKLRN